MNRMNVLSLETATYFGGVGYVGPSGESSAGPFEPRGASREVLAAVDRLLAEHGCGPNEIDLVVVSTGPGLFTGVRVGMSIAKALVWAQGTQGRAALVGLPTLEAVASIAIAREGESPAAGDWVAAITDARRGEIYAALFEVENAELKNGQVERMLRAVGPDVVVRPDVLALRLIPRSISEKSLWIVGDGAIRYESLVHKQFAPSTRIVPFDSANLPILLARLGRRRFEQGGAISPEALHPHYVRRPDARPPVLRAIGANET